MTFVQRSLEIPRKALDISKVYPADQTVDTLAKQTICECYGVAAVLVYLRTML